MKGPHLSDGRTAQIFAWGDDKILKLFRPGFQSGSAAHEAQCIRAVHAAGINTPALVDVVQVEGRKGLILERIDGPTMLEDMLSRPEKVDSYAQLLAELQAQLHGHTISGLASLVVRLKHKIERARPLPIDLKSAITDYLDRLPDGEVICHGDFHPGNIIMTANGPTIIDWIDVTQGPPLADVARTCLLLGHAAPLEETAASYRSQIDATRYRFLEVYLARYTELRPFDPADLAAWELPIAAARLEEEIGAEEESLLKIVKARLLNSAGASLHI